MRIKTLMITVSLALFFLAIPQNAHAQKNGEAQAVSFDADDRPTLKFTNKGEKRDCCGLFVSYTLMDNKEEALAVKVDHMHRRVQIWGGTSFPERGWLYITPSRIIFIVEAGDKAHAFDVPRTDLEDKSGTRFRLDWAGIQINLKERLTASDSREQKFVFLIPDDRKCRLYDPSRFNKFLERAVNDFDSALAEFKQLTASLKQAGKIQQAPMSMVPPGNSDNLMAAPYGNTTLPSSQADSPNPGQDGPGNTGVEITSNPNGAEIYVDGRFKSTTPSKILLGVGEHTIKVRRCGSKDWERKIIVEQGSVKSFNAILEKQ